MVAFVLAKHQKGYRGFYKRLPLWYHNGDACGQIAFFSAINISKMHIPERERPTFRGI